MSQSDRTANPAKQVPPLLSTVEKITEKLCDFHDRLPPMVVKELRQGMRARAFVGVFLTLQGFLALVMLFAISSGGTSDAGETVSRIIFFFFTVAVLCIQPLRAVNALHGEIKSGAIDLMVLTKLSARRIAIGKWAAIMAQSLLIFVSIAPYLILRYFFGGMNLFAELLTLTTILIASGCVTAINVGVSANGAILLRSLVPLAAGAFLFFGTCGVCFNREFREVIEFMSMNMEHAWGVYAALMVGALYISWMMFGLSISAIAPLAENHSTFNRIVAVAVAILVAVTMYFVEADKRAYPFALGSVIMPIVLFAFCEPKYLLAIVTRPFVKRGLLGRLFGSVMYPCSSAGIFYGLGMIAILVIVAQIAYGGSSSSSRIEMHAFVNSVCASMLFSAILLQLLMKRIENLLGVYIGIVTSGLIIFGAIAAICESMNNDQAALLFFWIPQVNFYNLEKNEEVTLFLSYMTLFVYGTILFVYGLRGRNDVIRAEKEEMDLYR